MKEHRVASKDKGVFVSASVIKDYLKCSQMAYYRIFEPELKISNREMVIGDIVHKAIEKAWQDKDVALNLAFSLCKKQDVDAVGVQSVEHFINTFFERFSFLLSKEDKVEKFFKIKYYDDVYLVGKFDRINKGTVLDWKTTANPPKKVDNDPQFIIYDLAYTLLYGNRPEGLYYASLKEGNLIRYNESKEHSTTLIEKVIPRFVEDVRRKNFAKTGLFSGACYRCPFKVPCLGEKSGLVYSDFTQE
jgi:PD-(D/E)XK nuclease superfamily protein